VEHATQEKEEEEKNDVPTAPEPKHVRYI